MTISEISKIEANGHWRMMETLLYKGINAVASTHHDVQ